MYWWRAVKSLYSQPSQIVVAFLAATQILMIPGIVLLVHEVLFFFLVFDIEVVTLQCAEGSGVACPNRHH